MSKEKILCPKKIITFAQVTGELLGFVLKLAPCFELSIFFKILCIRGKLFLENNIFFLYHRGYIPSQRGEGWANTRGGWVERYDVNCR